MQTRPDNPSIPAWSHDELDSPNPPEAGGPCFDPILDAWVLTHHADVLAALRSSSLTPSSPTSTQPHIPADEDARRKMRSEVANALSPAQLDTWLAQLKPEIDVLASALPIEQPVDLMGTYARPLCLSLAAFVTGISRQTAEELAPLARQTSAATADPFDSALAESAKSAAAVLRAHLSSVPEALRDSGFIGLSQTMPCILGNAWYSLMQYPHQWDLLHRQPALIGQAIDELLRYAGLVRILGRTASADIELNGTHIRKGQRLILRIIAANRDPGRFPHPNQVDIERRAGGHLSLGAGLHACVAAHLIRRTAAAVTQPLVERFATAHLAKPVDWQGGSSFRSPKSLWVTLTRPA